MSDTPTKTEKPETAERLAMEMRRERVARLTLQGKSGREIAALMVEMDPPIVVSRETVRKDRMALARRWRAAALADTESLRGQELAHLLEVRRRAHEECDLNVAVRTEEQIAKLLGLNAPTKVAQTDPSGERMANSMTLEDLETALEHVLSTVAEAPAEAEA